MSKYLSLAVLFLAVCSVQAFVFGRSDIVAEAEGRAVEESCLNLADQGDCGFYSCFEERLPCGRSWYILRQGHFYCNKIERMRDTFSEQAQHFLHDSQRCLMQSLKDVYRQERVSCHTLEHDAIDAISDCFIDNGFCSALRGNYANFFNIYEVSDLFSIGAGKVWREILSLAAQCSGDALEEITATVGGSLSDTIGDAVSSVRNRVSDLFNFRK